jgi:hypothetical protein
MCWRTCKRQEVGVIVCRDSYQHAHLQLDEMSLTGPPTEQEIWKIARRTTDIIERCITSDVCVFGSAASSLWADIGRIPNVCGTSFCLILPPN